MIPAYSSSMVWGDNRLADLQNAIDEVDGTNILIEVIIELHTVSGATIPAMIYMTAIESVFGISSFGVVSERYIAGTTTWSQHCLSGDTLVTTRSGTREIADLSGSVETILTIGDRWVDAPFRSFGEHPVQAVTISRGRTERTIRASLPHRWFIGDEQREVATSALQVGDRLTMTVPQAPWVVRGVADAGSTEVFCPTVTGTGAFTLDGGILTGNSYGNAVDTMCSGDTLRNIAFWVDSNRSILRINHLLADPWFPSPLGDHFGHVHADFLPTYVGTPPGHTV